MWLLKACGVKACCRGWESMAWMLLWWWWLVGWEVTWWGAEGGRHRLTRLWFISWASQLIRCMRSHFSFLLSLPFAWGGKYLSVQLHGARYNEALISIKPPRQRNNNNPWWCSWAPFLNNACVVKQAYEGLFFWSWSTWSHCYEVQKP